MVVGYVLDFFPQLSESFVENELACMRDLDVEIRAFSMYPPRPDLAAPTSLPRDHYEYRPGALSLTAWFLLWALRRPVVTAKHVAQALRIRSQTQLRGVWSAGWVAQGLRRHGAQHVHAHFGHDAAATAMAAGALANLPYTLTIHAHELYLRTNGLDLRCSSADRIVTVCDYNVVQLLERCPNVKRDNIEIVYCGVDPERFPFVERSAHEGPPRLVSVGRLVDTKGFDDLINALALLRERGQVIDCEIVGHGPLRSDLESLVAERGLQDHVRFAGPLPPDKIAARLAGCDVFVLACRIDAQGSRDSMPVVIKEAMSTGVPVVSTREAAVPEMVDDEVGRLAPPYDPPALADAIGAVLALPLTERAAMGRRGRDRVVERFNVRTETARLKKLFERLAG